MNKHQEALMSKPDLKRDDGLCPFCLNRVQSGHHIVPRSQGGAKGPIAYVCGYDNVTGCHGLIHQHILHLDWNERKGCWEYKRTKKPCKWGKARQMRGWVIANVHGVC